MYIIDYVKLELCTNNYGEYKGKEKIHLGVSETKRLNNTGLLHSQPVSCVTSLGTSHPSFCIKLTILASVQCSLFQEQSQFAVSQ
jgi:hypothetical protein